MGGAAAPPPPRPLLAVPNVTAHPSTASVPVTVLLYKRPWLCGFNVPIKSKLFVGFVWYTKLATRQLLTARKVIVLYGKGRKLFFW